MQIQIRRILCGLLLLGTMGFCSGCFRASEETGAGYRFTTVLSGNPECLDPQFSDNPHAGMVICNIMEGLVRTAADGTITEAQAESYVISDGGLTYMFNLREDCFWYQEDMQEEDAIPVTAEDYVFAFRRMLDPATRSPYAGDFACIKNASSILAGTMDCTQLGISALDAHTVMFTLEYPNAEFLELLAQPCAVPCNEAFFESTNGRYGLTPSTTLCNGPFCLVKWNYDPYGPDNFLTFCKNEMFYDKDAVYPSDLTFTIMRSQEQADTNFADGESDVILTTTYNKTYESDKYTVREEYTDTLGLIFNPENRILQNESFRLALLYGLDRNAAYAELGTDLLLAYGIIPPAVTLLGQSYREICADEPMAADYAPEQAAALFSAAMQELELNGTGSVKILVSTEIADTDALLAIGQGWQDLFGSYIGIETVTPAEFDSRIVDGDYSIALYNIHGRRNSCYDVLHQFREQSDILGFSSETYDGLMAQIAVTSQLSETAALYEAAEQAVLDTGCFVPLFYKKSYLIYTSDNQDVYGDPFAGTITFRDAKHFG